MCSAPKDHAPQKYPFLQRGLGLISGIFKWGEMLKELEKHFAPSLICGTSILRLAIFCLSGCAHKYVLMRKKVNLKFSDVELSYSAPFIVCSPIWQLCQREIVQERVGKKAISRNEY